MKIKYLVGAASIAVLVALAGCTTEPATQGYTPVYPYSGYGYMHGPGPYYYTDGNAFTNADGSHVESQSGVVPQ